MESSGKYKARKQSGSKPKSAETVRTEKEKKAMDIRPGQPHQPLDGLW